MLRIYLLAADRSLKLGCLKVAKVMLSKALSHANKTNANGFVKGRILAAMHYTRKAEQA